MPAEHVAMTSDLHAASHRRGLVTFVLLAYGLTWLPWCLADEVGPQWLLLLLGGLGPMAAALVVTGHTEGRAGLGRLLRRLRRPRLPWRWWVAAAGGLVALRVLPALLAVPDGVPWGDVGEQMAVLPLTFAFVAVLGGGLDEEVGWRGYALPRLQALTTPLRANGALGIVWSAWHLPLWWVDGSTHADHPFALYLVSTTALSVLLGAASNAAGGNLLVPVLLHAVSNTGDNLRLVAVHGSGDGTILASLVVLTAAMAAAAVAVAVRTRGRLCLHERRQPAPAPALEEAR